MLTRQQRYELYHCGVDRMLHFVEQLLSHLAEVERHVGHRQQYTIDRLLKDVRRLVKRVESPEGATVEAGDVELPTTAPRARTADGAGAARRAGQ